MKKKSKQERRNLTQAEIDGLAREVQIAIEYEKSKPTPGGIKMTPQEARIFLLECALMQAQHTISFMHGCLTNPEMYKYTYPDQTVDRLKWFETLAKPDEGCFHSSGAEPGCMECQKATEKRRKYREAMAVLKMEG